MENSNENEKSMTSETGLGLLETSLAIGLCKKKGIEDSPEVISDTQKALERLYKAFDAIAKEASLKVDELNSLRLLTNTLDEAHGNFGKDKISFEKFVSSLADETFEVQVKSVDPLEYFSDIGNIASVESLQKERDELPAEIRAISNPKERAARLINYIDEDHHVGVDHDMFVRDLERGKDHNATMRYLLGFIARGEALNPGFVGRFVGVREKYGVSKTGEALDGTHRAVAALVTGEKYFVIEVNMDEIMRPVAI